MAWHLLEAFELYSAEHEIRGTSPRTISFYSRHIQHFLDQSGVTALDEWTAPNITGFLLAKRATCANGGLHAYYRCFRAFSNWLTRRELISKNPMQHVPQPKLDKNRKPEPFTVDEVRKLLAVAKRAKQNYRAEALVLLLFDTGIRSGEVMSIKLADVDWAGRSVTVRGKTGERTVPISQKTLSALKRYLDRERTRSVDEQHLFLANGYAIDRAWVYRYFQQLSKRAGITRSYRGAHALRHGFAVQFIRNGGDVFHLRELLSHTDLEMSRRDAKLAQTDIRRAHHRYSPIRSL